MTPALITFRAKQKEYDLTMKLRESYTLLRQLINISIGAS
jgi:hypothetical protein